MAGDRCVTLIWNQVVMVGALFFVKFVEVGVVKSFGVLMDDLVVQLDSDLGKIGLIIGLFNGIASILGPVIAPAVNHIRMYQLAGIGLLGGLCVCASSFSINISQFAAIFITAGFCFAFVVNGVVIIFKRTMPTHNFALTYGFGAVGSSIGMMILPLLVEFLREHFGFRSGILILGGFILHCAPLLLLIKSREYNGSSIDKAARIRSSREEIADNHQLVIKQRQTEDDGGKCGVSVDQDRTDCEVFEGEYQMLGDSLESSQNDDVEIGSTMCCRDQRKESSSQINSSTYFGGKPMRHLWTILDLNYMKDNLRLMLFNLYKFFASLVSTAWMVFLIPHGVSKGIPLSEATFLASLGGFGNLLGRLIPGPIIHKRWMTSVDLIIAMTIGNAIVFLLDPVSDSFLFLGVTAFMAGVTMGCTLTAGVVILPEFAPPGKFPTVFGWSSLFYGLGQPVGGFIAGWLSDRLSFEQAFLVLGGINIVAVAILIGFQLLQKQKKNGN